VLFPPVRSGTSPASAGALAVQTRPIRIAARLDRRMDRLLDFDPIGLNRIKVKTFCLSMIFSENRFPLFEIML
jgi:hypothetical protein